MEKHAVITFGRFSPVHSGHARAVGEIGRVAKSVGGTPMLFASHTRDKKKNPLDYDDKVGYLQKAFGGVVKRLPKEESTLIGVLKHVNKTHDHLHVVAGTDRHQRYKDLIDKYNGKDFHFKSVTMHEVPRSESAMSATKMRAHAASGDIASFKKGLPSKLRGDAEEIFNKTRHGMGLHESFDSTVLRATNNMDLLLISGLADKNELSMYRAVLRDPNLASYDTQYRPMLMRMFVAFRDAVFLSRDIYDRVRYDLIHDPVRYSGWKADQLVPVTEGISDSSIDYLLKLGLGEPQFLTIDRRVISAPSGALRDVLLRRRLISIFKKLRNLIVRDDYIFHRVRARLSGRGNIAEENR